ncbi:MAG: metal ABC transporter substrate-binding protein, partial [Aquificaceae bacterium]|nr:metal ABC transporter substrate-binding protein [Aquificaceae bacterium]
KLRHASAFVYLGVEGWERQLASRATKALPLHRGINFLKVGRHQDPHVWLSPKAYQALVENLTQTLIDLDRAGEGHYRKKGEEFLKGLRLLEEDYRKVLSTCQDRVLVTTHLSTAYLGRDYGLEVVGLRGVHAEEEPRPSEVKKMAEKIKQARVKTLFHEKGHEEKLARRLAEEVGAKVLPLNTSLFPEEKGDDYFSIMRRNLKRLAEGLHCQTK